MDISVSHLIRRMTSQLPPEFPLGLVFVVGGVAVDSSFSGNDDLREFYLLEENHQLLCRLSPRVAEEISLKEGDLIRAGGHIVFEPAQARYYLLARDVELLREFQPAGAALGGLVAASRPSQNPELVQSPLPDWVKELAPPEVQEEWIARRMAAPAATLAVAVAAVNHEDPELTAQVVETAISEETTPAARAIEGWQEFGEADVSLAYNTEEPALAELSDELIAFLSEAIDSEEVVEITPAILAELTPASPPPVKPPPVKKAVLEKVASDPERAYVAQETSIEEFLSSLEAAISADESRLDRKEPDLDSRNGQATADFSTQRSASLSHSTADTQIASTVDLPPDQIQSDQKIPMAPAKVEQNPQESSNRPATDPTPSRKLQQTDMLPWFIVLLVILAGVLLLAIFAVLFIGSGLIPSITL